MAADPSPPPPAPPADPPGGRTFTQEEVGRLIAQDRRERSGGLDELKAENEALKARVAELEPHVARAGELEKTVEKLAQTNEGLLVGQAVQAEAARRGAWDPDGVARLLGRDGITVKDGKVEGADKAVEEFQKSRPNYFTPPAAPPRDGGSRENPPAPPADRGMSDIVRTVARGA